MKTVNYEIEVIEENCTGCYLCERICPTGAIVMEGPKSSALAVVNNNMCVACFRCLDICDDDALLAPERKEPLQFGFDPSTVDQKALADLLGRAGMEPEMASCICTMTANKEIAAAIIDGARTIEEVALKTGAQGGCLMYCFAPIHRMLLTYWGDVPESTSKNKWYPSSLTLLDVSDEVAERHPEFSIKEEKEMMIDDIKKAIALIWDPSQMSSHDSSAAN